jgi:hypothetical protein
MKSSQTASPIRQREELFVSEISFSNHSLSLSFRHASPYIFTYRCYSKAQATAIPNITRLLPCVSRHSLTETARLAPAHTRASRTNPNEARQFGVEFNKSRARAILRNSPRRTMFGPMFNAVLSRASPRCCTAKRQAPYLNTHWI